MSKIISVWSPKGGVGKTTITLALASYYAHTHNLKVGVIDLDPQSATGTYLPQIPGLTLRKSQVDSDALTIIDCPPGNMMPSTEIVIAPITLDPLSYRPTMVGVRSMLAAGKKVLLVPNRYTSNRQEEKSVLSGLRDKITGLAVIPNRSIYPKLVGMRKGLYESSIANYYGLTKARQDISALAKQLDILLTNGNHPSQSGLLAMLGGKRQ